MYCGASSKTPTEKRPQNAARGLRHVLLGEALRWPARLPRKRRSFKCRLGRSLKFSLAREERIYKGKFDSEKRPVQSERKRRRRDGDTAENKGKTCTDRSVCATRENKGKTCTDRSVCATSQGTGWLRHG